MPRLVNVVPKYRHHKATGQAVVNLTQGLQVPRARPTKRVIAQAQEFSGPPANEATAKQLIANSRRYSKLLKDFCATLD